MTPMFVVRCSCGASVILESRWLGEPLGTWPLGYHERHPAPEDLHYQIDRILRRFDGG